MKGQIEPNETLKVITWEPNYMVSDYGNIYRIVTKDEVQELVHRKPYLGKVGYYVVVLKRFEARAQPRYIHRIVAEAFLPPRQENHEVRHLDGNRLNNHVSNLMWGTRRENVQDTIRHGRNPRGESSCLSKLTELDVHVIRYLLNRGASAWAVSGVFKMSQSAIAYIRDGHHWRHLAERPLEEVIGAENKCHPEHVCGKVLLPG